MRIRFTLICIMLTLMVSSLLGCQSPPAPTKLPVERRISSGTSVPNGAASTEVVYNATEIKNQEQLLPPASTTPKPTSTPQPDPTETPTATASPSATPIGLCDTRNPSDESLTTIVTLDYGISRGYKPADLVNLSDHLPVTVTLGYPSQVRDIVAKPLTQMVQDMLSANLQPQIISGYRSYSSQAIAWSKWVEEVPDRAAIVSAPPGHSEHQLGTTVDFGSPELALIVGDEDVRFHTDFYKTDVGQWLAENAHHYGFTMSFSRDSFEVSGLYYEPWHFRYVGADLAGFLKENDVTLIQYILEKHGVPCSDNQ